MDFHYCPGLIATSGKNLTHPPRVTRRPAPEAKHVALQSCIPIALRPLAETVHGLWTPVLIWGPPRFTFVSIRMNTLALYTCMQYIVINLRFDQTAGISTVRKPIYNEVSGFASRKNRLEASTDRYKQALHAKNWRGMHCQHYCLYLFISKFKSICRGSQQQRTFSR